MHKIRTRLILIATVGLLWAAAGCKKTPSTAPTASTTATTDSRRPLPENRTLDSIGYGFPLPGLYVRERDPLSGPHAYITISREGKVRYHYESNPNTDSGGYVINKEW